MRSIYHYGDHKLFLKDWFLERKKSPSGFSYEKFSQMAGLGSPNYMKMVIDGRRNLTVANIHQVAEALRLGFDERQYFEALTLFVQSKAKSEKSYFKRRLREIKSTKPMRSLGLKRFDLVARWYFPAIVVVLDGCAVSNAIQSIKEKTGLEASQIEEVISILKGHKMLCVEGGQYKVEFAHFLVHDEKALSSANKNYLREQLKLGAEMLEKKYSKGPKFFAHTFTVSKDSFLTYADKIDSFIESLSAQSNEESPEDILQLNVQLFRILDKYN